MNNEFWANIISITPIAKDTSEVTLSFNGGQFQFTPGQYVWVVLPKLEFPDPKGERRAFSISSSSLNPNTISIIFRNSDSGFKKTLLNTRMDVAVKVIGPFGSAYTVSKDSKNIIMVAGGVGIAPFLSILRSLTDTTSHFSLINVNSSPEKGVYYDELKKITSEHAIQFNNHIGDIKENIFPSSIDAANDEFFICGPVGMVDTTYNVLKAKGVPSEHMRFEQFYPTVPGDLTEEDFKVKPNEKNIMLQAIEQSNQHVIVTNENGVILYANKAAQNITGYTLEEMRGNTPRIWGGLMDARFYQDFWEKKKKGEAFVGKITNRRKNGEVYHAQIHVAPFTGHDGTKKGYIGTEEDITSQILLEEQIESEKVKDEALIANIGDGILSVDDHGNIMRLNQAACGMLKMSQQELMGQKLSQVLVMEDGNGKIVPEKDRPVSLALSGNITTSTMIGTLYYYVRPDKSKFPIAITVTPVILKGKIIGAIEVFRDITREADVDRMKTEFISLASHQLRTPLTAMKWFSEMLLSGDAGPLTVPQKEYASNISDSNERMIDLVNSLLNISRIESGRIIIDPKPTDIEKLIQGIVREIQIKSNLKNQKITVTIAPNIPQINLDSRLIGEVYANLLTNASKYTPNGGEISVIVSVKDNTLLSQITDNGYGIMEKDKSQVFSKFFRGENISKVETSGTGLGLYLVKAIIDSSGGKIWFESNENHGTTFWFTLPLAGMPKKEGEVTLDTKMLY